MIERLIVSCLGLLNQVNGCPNVHANDPVNALAENFCSPRSVFMAHPTILDEASKGVTMRRFFLIILTTLCVLATTNSEAYVRVRGYQRSNGTVVAPYIRTSPNKYRWDNFSSRLTSESPSVSYGLFKGPSHPTTVPFNPSASTKGAEFRS